MGLLLQLVAMMMMFTACNKEKVQFIEKEFDGVYKGTLTVEVNDANFGELAQKVYITKSGENKFKLELKNFAIAGLQIGDIIVNNIAVTKDGMNCTFTGTENIDIMVGNCNVEVNGGIIGKDIDMDINVEVVEAMGAGATPYMNVDVAFEGSKMDADQSSEALLTAFTFDMDNEANAIVSSQPVIEGTNITFTITETATEEQIKALMPTIKISEKAKITPEKVDFNNTVTYTVTSEDGIFTTKYTVSAFPSLKFSFEEWTTEGNNVFEEVKPIDVLGSANMGTYFLALYGFTGFVEGDKTYNVNTVQTEGTVGRGARLITFDSRSIANTLVPGITSGALFMGKFNIGAAMEDRLTATEFGLVFNKKEPITFKGSYKYTAGEVYYDASDFTDIKVVEDTEDQFSIIAVLFEIENETDVLTGKDINTSDKRVAVAAISDGTPKSEWTTFELPFTFLEGKQYDANKNYKIAFVCSSSKDGDRFRGAPSSSLYVDEFEIVYKTH